MKRLAIALLALMLVAFPAAATEDKADYIDQLAATVDVSEGGNEAAYAELYAISTDVTISPECQRYADITLIGFGLIEYVALWPSSWSVQVLFDFVVDALPTFRFDCQNAI